MRTTAHEGQGVQDLGLQDRLGEDTLRTSGPSSPAGSYLHARVTAAIHAWQEPDKSTGPTPILPRDLHDLGMDSGNDTLSRDDDTRHLVQDLQEP